MSDVVLTGLSQLEVCRLRFQLAADVDPFIDAPLTIDASLADVINSLRGAYDTLYPTLPTALALVPPADSPSVPATGAERLPVDRPVRTRADKEPLEKKSGGRGYVNWGAIVKSLLVGAIDEYACTQKASTASTTKCNLVKKFPGLDVDVTVHGTTAAVSVRLGEYDPDARAHA